MIVFYFDHVNPDGIVVDDVGTTFNSNDLARIEASSSLAEEVKVCIGRGQVGRVSVIVRGESGPLFEFGATLDIKDFLETASA